MQVGISVAAVSSPMNTRRSRGRGVGGQEINFAVSIVSGLTRLTAEVYTESSRLAWVGLGLLWVTVWFWCGL